MNEFSDLLTDITDALDAIDGLTAGPVPFDATALPDSLTTTKTHAAYTIDMQSVDTGTERQAALIRPEHIVTVSVMSRVKGTGQWVDTLGKTLDVEQVIIAALLTTQSFRIYDVRWGGTARSLTTNREYILHQMAWSFESTIKTGRA